MSDNPKTAFASRFASEPPSVVIEPEAEENLTAFGYLRGVKERALMLEMRLKDGSSVAYSYALLDRASFDPSDGIRLHFPRTEIVIRGRGLNQPAGPGAKLFDLLLRQRVTWIQEASRGDVLSQRTEKTIVEAIAIDS